MTAVVAITAAYVVAHPGAVEAQCAPAREASVGEVAQSPRRALRAMSLARGLATVAGAAQRM
jgi:hypothetical protein